MNCTVDVNLVLPKRLTHLLRRGGKWVLKVGIGKLFDGCFISWLEKFEIIYNDIEIQCGYYDSDVGIDVAIDLRKSE